MTHPYRSAFLSLLPTRAFASGSSTVVLGGITVASAALTATMWAAQDAAVVPFGVLTLTYLVLTAISARLDTLYREQQTRAAIRRRLAQVCARTIAAPLDEDARTMPPATSAAMARIATTSAAPTPVAPTVAAPPVPRERDGSHGPERESPGAEPHSVPRHRAQPRPE